MSAKFNLVEENHPVMIMAPATDAAGRTSTYVNAALAERTFIVVTMTQGNAATVLLSLLQATAAAGTGSKALVNTVPIWADLDTAAADTLTRVSPDAVSYTTDAGVKNKVVIFQIDGEKLDIANSFKYIAVSTGASNAANITSAYAIFGNLRYGQPLPLTVIT